MVTAATAMLVPRWRASSGVSMLPMPNPTTEAVAPESSATRNTAGANQVMGAGLVSLPAGRPCEPRCADGNVLGFRQAP